MLPAIGRALSMTLPKEEELTFECQITAHTDGGYYVVHNDNSDPTTKHRLFSYVFYFKLDGAEFFGGDLKLYADLRASVREASDLDYLLIKPDDNSLVVFPSNIPHEVMLTRVPSGRFTDSRFTVNGWVGTSTS
jgi:Rps23 Pro-64 3,4-dihydroxylase Tpa1-like proline 4-hydroxylase